MSKWHKFKELIKQIESVAQEVIDDDVRDEFKNTVAFMGTAEKKIYFWCSSQQIGDCLDSPFFNLRDLIADYLKESREFDEEELDAEGVASKLEEIAQEIRSGRT